jgi:hypothetical protein
MGADTASVGRRIAAVVAVSAAVTLGSGAAEDASELNVEGASALCRSKAALLARYLESEPVRELAEAGSPASVEMIDRARALQEENAAGAVADGGCAQIDEALRLVSAAAAQSGVRQENAQDQHAHYLERARQFDAYVQAISLTARNTWPQEVRRRFAAAELKSAEAAKRAGEGDFARAEEAIEAAYGEMLEIVRALNDGKMVVHELIFKTPEEEYRYEKERNRSYEMLLQIAAEDFGASPELRAHVAQVIARNNLSRQGAEQKAASGEAAGAIREMEAASRDLAKTLRLTGVMVWE